MTPERYQQVVALFQAASDLEGGERAALLERACAGDEELRREVESLLSQDGRASGGVLDRPAFSAQMLLKGARLGPYTIETPLGAGGMGEVFRALDTRLGRPVAIKISAQQFSGRFEREARAISALNHPHICTLFDVGPNYLVMELVEGETLAARLKKGPLPFELAVQYGAQIADALAAAHAKGIIHRDLKPGNIMLAKNGVKVLDFGLAKAPQDETLTAANTVMGTPAYMAPEQREGRQCDARTDIYALGLVLREISPDLPPQLAHVVERCLANDPDDRWQAASDVRKELEWAARTAKPAPGSPATTAASPTGLRWRTAWLWGGALMLLAIIAVVAIWRMKPSAAAPGTVSRVAVTLQPGQVLAGFEAGEALALSPDGTRLAYVARQEGIQQLYLRALDGLEAKLIPGSEGAVEPFFSPDSQWLGFFAGGKLKKVPVSGGEAVSIADATDARGGTWASDGRIIFVPRRADVLWQVSEAGGTPQPVTQLTEAESSHRWPELLPGGKAVLFAAGDAGRNWDSAQVAVQLLGSGQRRILIPRGTHPRYVPSGHLVFALGGTLMAAPFDLQRMAVLGTPAPVIEGVLQLPLTGAAQYSVSTTGSLAYVPASAPAVQRKLVWVNRDGREEPLNAPARPYRQPRLSPDGRRLAVAIEGPDTQIWIYDFTRETLTRLTIEGNTNNNPVWTPDGKRIVFTSNRSGAEQLTWQLADGSGGPERVSDVASSPSAVSPDGQTVAADTTIRATGWDIWMVSLLDGKSQSYLHTPFNEGATSFSPDGRWLAYTSDASGRYEIYVQAYPGPGPRWQISSGGGTEPMWARNGKELFYRSSDGMMGVEIQTHSGFSAGKPKLLFRGRYQPPPRLTSNYDVSPDGRFLMLKPAEEKQGATQVNIVQNWPEELKRLAPVSK